MRRLEERSGVNLAPEPRGRSNPTLQMLEDEGLVHR